MNISDIISLAQAGYKPSDVYKLLEMVETSPAIKEANSEKVEDAKQIDDAEVLEEPQKIVTTTEKEETPSAEDLLDKLFE